MNVDPAPMITLFSDCGLFEELQATAKLSADTAQIEVSNETRQDMSAFLLRFGLRMKLHAVALLNEYENAHKAFGLAIGDFAVAFYDPSDRIGFFPNTFQHRL